MISMNCHGVAGILLGTPQYFPAHTRDSTSFWSLEILVKVNQGRDAVRLVAFANHPEELEFRKLALPAPSATCPVSVALATPALPEAA
jgi:hypothetical protein